MTTGVPSGATRTSQRRSASGACTQPAETAWPKSLGESVPWIATRFPPAQLRGRFGSLVEGRVVNPIHVDGEVAHYARLALDQMLALPGETSRD